MNSARHSAAGVASPCINVCQMDADSGLCRGCFRTLDEIAAWAGASDSAKTCILAAVDKRRSERHPGGDAIRVDGRQ